MKRKKKKKKNEEWNRIQKYVLIYTFPKERQRKKLMRKCLSWLYMFRSNKRLLSHPPIPGDGIILYRSRSKRNKVYVKIGGYANQTPTLFSPRPRVENEWDEYQGRKMRASKIEEDQDRSRARTAAAALDDLVWRDEEFSFVMIVMRKKDAIYLPW